MSGGQFICLEEENDEYTDFVLLGGEAIEVPIIGPALEQARVIYVNKRYFLELQKLKLVSKSKSSVTMSFDRFFKIMGLLREFKAIPQQLVPLLEKIKENKPLKIETVWKLDILALTELLRLQLRNSKLEKTLIVKIEKLLKKEE